MKIKPLGVRADGSCAERKDGVHTVLDRMQYLRLILNSTILKFGIIILLILVIIVSHWNVKSLDSLFLMKRLVPDNRNLFFIETTCALNTDVPPGGLRINSRQACAIYSTAILNPSRQIILYHSCPLHKEFYERSTLYNKYLLDLPNVYIIQTELHDLMKGSIIEHMYEDLQRSSFPIEHTADIIRLLMVYKFGGAYLDLDFISLKPINILPNNFIGAESETMLSNGVFQFEQQGEGHEFVREMLEDLALNYNTLSWGGNGPELFTKIFRKFCNVSEDMPITAQISYPCGISVTNTSYFYPVKYKNWQTLFEPARNESVKDLLKHTVAIHFWNSLSKDKVVSIGEHSPYELIAREYCNKIFLCMGPKF